MTNVFNDDFIYSEEKRNNELRKIDEFYNSIDVSIRDIVKQKYGDPRLYITLIHFCLANNIDNDYFHIVRPVGYFSPNKIAVIYIPTVSSYDYIQIADMQNISIVHKILYKLNDMNPVKWIIDIRGNGGGVAHTFISYILPFISNYKIPYKIGDKIYNIKITPDIMDWKDDITHNETYMPPFNKISNNKKIDVYINENSYSGAEFITMILRNELGAKVYGEISGGALTTMTKINCYDLGVVSVPRGELLGEQVKKKKLTPDFKGYNIF